MFLGPPWRTVAHINKALLLSVSSSLLGVCFAFTSNKFIRGKIKIGINGIFLHYLLSLLFLLYFSFVNCGYTFFSFNWILWTRCFHVWLWFLGDNNWRVRKDRVTRVALQRDDVELVAVNDLFITTYYMVTSSFHSRIQYNNINIYLFSCAALCM